MWKFALFLLFEAADHDQFILMYVNIYRQILANLKIILYKECNKCDVELPVALIYCNSSAMSFIYDLKINDFLSCSIVRLHFFSQTKDR